MAELGWLNSNDRISYPLIDGDSRLLMPGCVTELPKEGLADAGFMLGLDSEFIEGTDTVTLYSVAVTNTEIIFDLRSSAVGMTAHRWLFSFSRPTLFGCTAQVAATPILGGPEDPDRGWGFMVCGNLKLIAALGLGTHRLCTPPRIEPALVQSLLKSFARSINIGNTGRSCPPSCCQSSATPVDEAHLYQSGIVGNVRFKEGKNTQLDVDAARNTIEIRGVRGAGDGITCSDVLIVGPGHEGFIPDDGSVCGDCSQYIRSVDGVATSDGRLRLSGGGGTNIVSDKTNHKLVVRIEPNRVCAQTSSVP